jgi:pterin-4a-carbinolamine dehydratase
MIENIIFLSYRRADTAPHTLALKLELEAQLSAAQVFVDTHQIRGADRWAIEIEVALRTAKVIMPVIGRAWVGPLPDGRRRIDDPEDWVRKELVIALAEKPNSILPLLVDDAAALDPQTLPSDLQGLAAIQAIRIDLSAWQASIDTLVGRLSERFGLSRKRAIQSYPRPDPLVARTIPIPWEELDDQVSRYLPKWTIEFSDDERNLHQKHIELTRTFEFDSFLEAIAFVDTVAQHAHQVQHHPRWMNMWRTVKIWLSTWDAGHRVTALDIEFARYLDRAFGQH